MPLILGISGSLRERSHNTVLLRAPATQLPPGVSLDVYDELREIPPYDADLDVEPVDPAVSRFRDAIARADGVLIATPEYNGSIPGVLKNALDWASRPFPDNALRGKPVAVIGASPACSVRSRSRSAMPARYSRPSRRTRAPALTMRCRRILRAGRCNELACSSHTGGGCVANQELATPAVRCGRRATSSTRPGAPPGPTRRDASSAPPTNRAGVAIHRCEMS
jgi:hypothetical protein